MMRKMMTETMRKTVSKTKANKKTVVMATAITTLLSATAAFAIKVFPKLKANLTKDDLKKEDKSEFETVMDGLVEDGTITQAQQVAIQSAITTAKEASIGNDDLTREDNAEVTTVPGSTKLGTITGLKNSLFKM